MEDFDRLTEADLIAWCESVEDRMDGIAEWTVTITARGPFIDGEHPHYAAISFHHLHPDARTIQLHGSVRFIEPERLCRNLRVESASTATRIHYSWKLKNGWKVVRVVIF